MHLPRTVVAVTLSICLASCSAATQTPEVCRGVPAELGGCDENQPTFSGTTCSEVGTQFGEQLDRRLMTVMNGPSIVDGRARSSQALAITILVTQRANEYLRGAGMVQACDADEFMLAAEDEFTDQLIDHAGSLVSEIDPHDYEDWLADLREVVQVIDQDEDLPYEGADPST